MNDTSSNAFQELRSSVQKNCHLSDAEHARNYSLCVYLMKMREYYRWEKGLALSESISREDVGDWVMDRERLWDALEEEDYLPLSIGGELFDPFDEMGVNAAIETDGLVYSSGLGRGGQAHFFLARLESVRRFEDLTVYVSACEYARDLTSPPAMALGRRIFVRRESLRRHLWEMADESRWSKGTGPMGRALAVHGEEDIEGFVDRMTDAEIETLTWHELGEVMAGEHLEPRWSDLLSRITGVKTELSVRAVRDHLADCKVTLPRLLDRDEPASIHLFFANLRGMRRELFPRLVESYDAWRESGATVEMRELVSDACAHWERVADDLLAALDADPRDLDAAVDALIAGGARY